MSSTSRTQVPGQTPHLGLIESTDAGEPWRHLSLTGQADFHALEAKHNTVHSYDSQSRQFLVSTDRQTRDRRASLALADFAVSPANPDVVLATTRAGLARSADGGRTFTAMPDTPTLLLVDWPAEAALVGVDPTRIVWISCDAGTSWARQGQVPGQPEALTTNRASELYVATDGGIYASADGGRTFALCQRVS